MTKPAFCLITIAVVLLGSILFPNNDAYGQVLDADNDGLIDFFEKIIGTDPNNRDTDGDGLLDGEEISISVRVVEEFFLNNLGCVFFVSEQCTNLFKIFINDNSQLNTSPLKADSDGDGFSDGFEVKEAGTDPLDKNDFPLDLDLDSLFGFEELQIGTDPNNRDTDNDGLFDGDEVNTFRTDPVNPDTDGDGIADGDEFTLGFDPLDTQDPFPPMPPKTGFDWTMPDRFGMDGDGDGLIDYFTDFASINPPSWQVDFDACDLLQPDPQIITYQWTVLGNVIEESTCDGFSFDFPNEGSFMVTLTATNTEGESASFTHEVIVQDWLVVSWGDSYASGEGNPDISVDGELVSMRINNLKIIKDQLGDDLTLLEFELDKAKESLVQLGNELSIAVSDISELDQNTFTCLGAQPSRDFSIDKIAEFTNLINDELNKDIWDQNPFSLTFWASQKLFWQGVLLGANETFDSIGEDGCQPIIDAFNDFSVNVKAIKGAASILSATAAMR